LLGRHSTTWCILPVGPFPPFFLETGSLCVAQAGLKLDTLLFLLPECWDYRCVPLNLVLGT
jgi:hypothetical protein